MNKLYNNKKVAKLGDFVSHLSGIRPEIRTQAYYVDLRRKESFASGEIDGFRVSGINKNHRLTSLTAPTTSHLQSACTIDSARKDVWPAGPS